MLDKILVLLERFVVAHELIAANSRPLTREGSALDKLADDAVKTGKDDTPAKATRGRKQAAKKEEPEDDEPEEKAPAKKRAGKTEAPAKTTRSKKGGDKRAAIAEMAKVVVEGDGLDEDDADALLDDFDDLLEDFEVKKVADLDDDQVEEFHDALKEIIEKYYDAE